MTRRRIDLRHRAATCEGTGLKILIVKLSSLGDVVHAMPAVADLRRAFPKAQIDWVVEHDFASLVRRCDGVQRVIACELRRWRRAPWSGATRAAWGVFKAELQHEAYDAVIDLQGLTKSALIAWLARLAPEGTRFGLANRTEGSSFEAPARWLAREAITVPVHIHAVTRARELCARAFGYEIHGLGSFGLLAPVDKAQAAIQNVADAKSTRAPVVFVHGTSRADKQWPTLAWVELGQRFAQQGRTVALTHGNDAEQARAHQIAGQIPGASVWPRLQLDAMCDAMARCAGVIGVDSGLSHIAVALDLPHVQIYNLDTAWRTGPQCAAHQRSVFAQPAPSVAAVWQGWLAVAGDQALP